MKDYDEVGLVTEVAFGCLVEQCSLLNGRRALLETISDRIRQGFGGGVRAVRTAMRMIQSELAQAAGLTFQQIQKYERGINRISASMLLQISQALKADFSALVAPEGGRLAQAIRGTANIGFRR
jgi:DNA-binding XRE family transcriptional regulator